MIYKGECVTERRSARVTAKNVGCQRSEVVALLHFCLLLKNRSITSSGSYSIAEV